MKYQVIGAVLLGVVFLGSPAHAGLVTINFDDLGPSTIVTNQYAGVSFSAGGGDFIMTMSEAPPYSSSAPNIICTATVANGVDCTHDVILSFTTPVDNLTFDAYGNQTTFGHTFAQADVYVSGILVNTVALTVTHFFDAACGVVDCDPDHLNFTSFAGITQLVIHDNTDNQGSAYDNFSFTQESNSTTVPEPSTLLLTGMVGLALVRRLLTSERV